MSLWYTEIERRPQLYYQKDNEGSPQSSSPTTRRLISIACLVLSTGFIEKFHKRDGQFGSSDQTAHGSGFKQARRGNKTQTGFPPRAVDKRPCTHAKKNLLLPILIIVEGALDSSSTHEH